MHEPTSTGWPHHNPCTCWLCGRRATKIGIGSQAEEDPLFLCSLCTPLVDQLRACVHFDAFEEAAIDDVIEKMGSVVEKNGGDLFEWSEETVRDFVVRIILEFGNSIRRQVKEKAVPF